MSLLLIYSTATATTVLHRCTACRTDIWASAMLYSHLLLQTGRIIIHSEKKIFVLVLEYVCPSLYSLCPHCCFLSQCLVASSRRRRPRRRRPRRTRPRQWPPPPRPPFPLRTPRAPGTYDAFSISVERHNKIIREDDTNRFVVRSLVLKIIQ